MRVSTLLEPFGTMLGLANDMDRNEHGSNPCIAKAMTGLLKLMTKITRLLRSIAS